MFKVCTSTYLCMSVFTHSPAGSIPAAWVCMRELTCGKTFPPYLTPSQTWTRTNRLLSHKWPWEWTWTCISLAHRTRWFNVCLCKCMSECVCVCVNLELRQLSTKQKPFLPPLSKPTCRIFYWWRRVGGTPLGICRIYNNCCYFLLELHTFKSWT